MGGCVAGGVFDVLVDGVEGVGEPGFFFFPEGSQDVGAESAVEDGVVVALEGVEDFRGCRV